MKKLVLIFCFTVLMFFPFNVSAFSNKNDYVTSNLEETLQSMGIELKNKDYKETDDQITIYLFKSSGCEYTKPLLESFNSMSVEYGKYFKLLTFDVDSNSNNMKLFQDVVAFLGKQPGVPFYIIGEETYLGYNKDAENEIAQTIKREYEKTDRYDVMEEMEKENSDDSSEDKVKDEVKDDSENFFKNIKESLMKNIESFLPGIFFAGLNILLFSLMLLITLLFFNKKATYIKKKLSLLKKKL